MAETHELMGGRLHVYKRPNSRFWQCSTFLAGRNWRTSTKEESLSHAKEIAEDWYLELRGKSRAGQLRTGRLFAEAAEAFLADFRIQTAGHRSEKYIEMQEMRVRVHLVPFFDKLTVSEIMPAKVQEYRHHRAHNAHTGKPTARSTLHQEIVALRQILKHAVRLGWLSAIPDLSPPYKASGKIGHRAWFSPEEYRQLYEATRARAAKPLNNRWRWECEQLHDYVLFMANTGLRPDEGARLQFRDVQVVFDEATNETILLIEVRGKRGVGYCKSTRNAVRPFERLRKRKRRCIQATGDAETRPARGRLRLPESHDVLFPGGRRDMLNNILDELKLKLDRDGNRRTAYSLRHTYICLRLTEGADIYQIAKNCRTSVEMIERFYATHIKTALDAAAINTRRSSSRYKVIGARDEAPTARPRRASRKALARPQKRGIGHRARAWRKR